MKILVINGPNLNMLGIREPSVYGTENYEALCECIRQHAESRGITVEIYQSNHEGDLVDAIQRAYGTADGIVINPAAYTHTSVAIADALAAVSIPAVEIHISKVNERESFRQISYTAAHCLAVISGEGLAGYAHAVRLLAEHIKKK